MTAIALDAKQRGVLCNMIAALALTIVALAAVVVWRPPFLLPLAAVDAQIAWALHWDALVLACLVLAIGSLARHRFFSPADIDGSGLTAGTDRARVLQAVLQNTLEQAVIAVIAHLVWAAALPQSWQAAVPAAAVLFVIGRIAFAAGYSGGAAARAFGFALTFYPSVVMLVVAGTAFAWHRPPV